MNHAAFVPLVAPHLLADRKGRLAAIELDIGDGDAALLGALIEHPDFRSLSERLSCVFFRDEDDHASDQLPPSLSSALQDTGCQPVSRSSVERVDHQFKSEYAPTVEWIEGSWYLSPPVKMTASQAASRAAALQLVQLVAGEADNREIEAVFRREPTLSYHLLRLVNSLGVGAGRRITSFSQALVILGRLQLRRWLNLMLFAAREGDQRSAMLLPHVAMRARAMELLARASGFDNGLQEQAFMTGMFSMLGILFGMPLEDVLRPLAIGEAMRTALLSHEGKLGQLLRLTEAAETGDFAAAGALLETLHLDRAEFNFALIQACDWMLGVTREDPEAAHG